MPARLRTSIILPRGKPRGRVHWWDASRGLDLLLCVLPCMSTLSLVWLSSWTQDGCRSPSITLWPSHLQRKNRGNVSWMPLYKSQSRTSLVVQWLRIHLPVQGTWVRALVREDSTCWRATKPVYHNYWACALEPVSHNYWAHVPQLLKPTCSRAWCCNYWAHMLQLLKPACLEPVLRNKRSHRNEKLTHCNEE